MLSDLKQVSPDEYNVSILFDQILSRNSWLNLFGKVRQAGTISKSSSSLKRLYECLLCDRPETVNVVLDNSHGTMTSVSNWSSSYVKKVNIQKFEKETDDLAQNPYTDELHKFDVSNVVEDCKFNLKKSCLANKLQSIQVFKACTGYITKSLILFNATHPGAL